MKYEKFERLDMHTEQRKLNKVATNEKPQKRMTKEPREE
jgi:hypothetical protein